VALEPTGWGTKVTVAAEPVEQAPPAPAVAEPPVAEAQAEAPAAKAEVEPPAADRAPDRRGLFARLFRRRPQVHGEGAPAAAPAEQRAPQAAEPVDADAVLREMLQSLGAAHHRPFSRG